MGFNGDNLKAIFDQRFGKGAFDSGVNQAYQNGRNQWMAQQQALQQQMYMDQQKQLAAQQKAQQTQQKAQDKAYKADPVYQIGAARSYLSDPSVNAELHRLGAVEWVKKLQNDPAKVGELKDQGYDLKTIADQAYFVASHGRYNSANDFKQYSKDLGDQTLTDNKLAASKAGFGKDVSQWWDTQLTKGQAENAKEAKAAKQAQLNAANDTLLAIHNDAVQRQVQQQGVGSFGDELQRGVARAANQITLGGLGALDQKLHGGALNPLLADRTGTGGWIDKASDFAGSALPFIASDGLTSAVGGTKLAALGEKGLAGKIGELAIRGAGSGALVGAGQEGVQALANPQDFNAKQALENIGLDAGIGAVANPLLHGGGNLLKQLNLKGQLAKVLENNQTQINPDEFVKTLQEMKQPSGNFSNVLADQPKAMPNLVENPLNIKSSSKPIPTNDPVSLTTVKTGKPLNEMSDKELLQVHQLLNDQEAVSVLTNNNPNRIHDINQDIANIEKEIANRQNGPAKGNDWFNFAQQGSNVPKARGLLPDVTIPKGESSNIRNLAEDTLNRSKTFENKPAEGFNQRLLDVQQEMKNLQSQTEAMASRLQGDGASNISYQPDPESLYQQVRKPNDPKTFDDLVKMAEMEHNAANPSLTTMLRLDPRVKQGINKLNELGKPTVKAPTAEAQAPKKVELKLPELNNNQNPHDLLQSLKVKSKETPPSGESKQGGKPLLMSLNPSDNIVKSIKTEKMLPSMNKAELQDTLSKLEKQEELLKKGTKGKKTESKLKQIEEDKKKVNDFLMKLDLQTFGEKAPKEAKSTPKEIAKEKAIENLDKPYQPGEELPDTSSHIETKTKKTPINVKSTADTAYIKTVDNLHRLSQFDNQVEQVLGHDLNASEKTHTLGLNSRGSDMISKQILTQNLVDKNGEVVGDSLKSITKMIPKGKVSEFEDYLVNKHAITRMERGEKVFPDEMNMTTGKSKEIVKNYEENNPKFKEIADKYYEFNKQLGQKWLVDTGILSKEQWEGYLKENPHYVPNNRIFSDLEKPKFGNSAKKGYANQSNPVKKATGSQRKIVSPIESTIEHTAQYVKTAKRNEVMQTLINNIKQNPEAFKDWAEIVPTDKTPESIMETLQKEGVDGVLENLNKGFDQKPDLTKGNIVTGIIDGQKVHVRVNDPQLLDALTNLQPKAQNIVIHALGQVTRVMKTLTTGINPVFSLTRNIFRDIPTAYANSKSTDNPFTFTKDLVGSVISVMKNDELYRSFKAVGGGHSSPISSSVNLLAQSKSEILPKKGLLPVIKKGYGLLENLNNAVESAPRLAEFKRLAGDSYDSKMKALYEANDVTVNFNKYGNVSKEIDSVIPYFNAAVQGLDKTGRMLLNPKTAPKVAVKAFVGITIPSMISYVYNHNNPDYQELSNYIKDNNIVIPKGDGTFYKIPVPREYGVIFHGGVNRVLRAWADKDPKAFEGFATTLLNNFALPTRSVLAPFNDLRANKNFVGAPIVPNDLQGLSPRYQYDAQTSEPAKKIGDILNVSPKQIDYLVKSYGGVLGELGIPATTKNDSIGQTLKQQVTADPVFSNDIMTNFYNTKTKLDQAHSDLTKQGIQSKDLNEAARTLFDRNSLTIGQLRKQTKQIQNDPNLTADERLKKLREIQKQMLQIAQKANQSVR